MLHTPIPQEARTEGCLHLEWRRLTPAPFRHRTLSRAKAKLPRPNSADAVYRHRNGRRFGGSV